MNEIAGSGAIRQTRFLLVDGDKAALAAAENILKAAGAPQVYLAGAPILALRVLQDANTRVDCVICAHKRGNITGLQFLQSLRAGRWGAGRIKQVKFVLTMDRLDVQAVQTADAAGASGYYVGQLEPRAFIEDIAKALSNDGGVSPLPKMKVAHVNMSGVDFVFVPTDGAFAQAAPANQQEVMSSLQALMQEQMLAGAVTPVWEKPDHGVGYFAAPQYHALLAGALTMDFVRTNLNRELTVLRPPRYATLSSPGSAAYAAYLAEEAGNTALGDGALNLSGYEAKPETPSSLGGIPGSGGVSGGSPPPPPAR